jgi:hypothetical protein
MTRTSKLLAIPAIGYARTALVAVAVLGLASTASFPLYAQASNAQSTGGQPPAVQSATTAERESALEGFNQRVQDYITLKKKLESDLPKPKPGDRATGKAQEHKDTIASRLLAARKDAKQGDIFGDAAPYFKRIIQHDTETRGVRDAYAAMQEVPAQSPPTVNALYPDKAALATVPPLILVNLPRLPDGLEYRFMGRDLILRDRDANLIIDFIGGAVPLIESSR